MKTQEKYFVTHSNGEFMVIYEDFSKSAGHFYSTEKDGFETETDAQKYADKINAMAK